MTQGKASEYPKVPSGGFEKVDNFQRCRKCSQDGLGTILSRVDISIRHRNTSNEPIARMVRCCRCGYIQESYLIPGSKDMNGNRLPSVAEENGITMAMLQKCLSQAVYESFDLSELKSGIVDGVVAKTCSTSRIDNYDPDKYIEQKIF